MRPRNGVIVRLGRRHGIPTPYNRMATALVEVATRVRIENPSSH
ncbi:MAG TPA: ketopantoate reductase C-terminal domain-containing protein [Opitutaceae bacterium]|nr:ketopantoate reductase C-terminal domain-containing protein [Opitutaceae bacterium]